MSGENEPWYTIKDIFEMVQDLQDKIAELTLEVKNVNILIRDYNGLRERVDRCEKRLDVEEGKDRGEEKTVEDIWNKAGYIFGALGVLIAIIALLLKR